MEATEASDLFASPLYGPTDWSQSHAGILPSFFFFFLKRVFTSLTDCDIMIVLID